MDTVVLVLTDVQGSTRLWADEPDAMDQAMRRHHAIIHAAVSEHGGWRPVDQGEGDAVFAAFRSATAAVACVARVQRELASEQWPTSRPLRVRVGMHIGEIVERDGNLYGDAVNRCARLRSLGEGGQTLLTSALFEIVRDVAPEGIGLLDLGEHRMKDLSRPERVYQLTGAGLDGPFSPLRSLDAVRHNLPIQTSTFIGREAELLSLVKAVREGRLTTLTGFGGMGKTRLALQAAAELADGSVGDVWFVDLSAVTDYLDVPARLAETIGVKWGTGDPAAALAEALKAQPTLLVLDNMEQVLGAAPFISALLSATAELRILATSREALRIRGERQLPLPPMALPSAGSDSSALSTYEAVRLFVDRATAVRPDFIVDNATAPAVAALVAKLDGHPLALELAAARLKVLSVDKLLQRLDAALSVLTGGSRDMPERHQTLRATIAWSYDALSLDEQRLLTRMSVFPAPADFEMIEAVCGVGLDVLDLLESLVEKSLVHVAERDGESQYGVLASIRDFAAEQLDAGERLELEGRHADHLLTCLNVGGSGQAENTRLIAFVRHALPHVRAALAHRFAVGPPEAAVDLVDGLSDSLIHLGLHAEYLDLSARALEQTDDPCRRGNIHGNRGLCLSHVGDVRGSSREGGLALAAARECDDPVVLANALAFAVDPNGSPEDYQALRAEFEVLAPQLAEEAARSYGGELDNIAAIIFRSADPQKAEKAARRLMQSEDADVGRVRLTLLLLDRGQLAEAEAVYAPVRQSSSPFNGRDTWRPIGLVVESLLATYAGRLEVALEVGNAALELWRRNGSRPLWAAQALSWTMSELGDSAGALAVLDESILPDFGDSEVNNATLHWRRAVVQLRAGDRAAAARDLELARMGLAPTNRTIEMLACLAIRAALLAESAPADAAQLLGCVAAHRRDWVLWFSLDREYDALLAELLPAHTEAFESGKSLDPHHAW